MILLMLANALASPALFQESYTLEAQYDYAQALERMDRVAPNTQPYLVALRRGWLLYLQGSYTDSVEAYREAEGLDPGSVEAMVGEMMPLLALRRWKEAVALCDKALAVAPGNYLAMSRRAYALYSMGRYTEAVPAYEQVVKQYPSDVEMRTGLGWALLKAGHEAKARAAFEVVLAVSPEHTSARQGMEASR